MLARAAEHMRMIESRSYALIAVPLTSTYQDNPRRGGASLKPFFSPLNLFSRLDKETKTDIRRDVETEGAMRRGRGARDNFQM